jgi:Holliday junction DNA helicase RuvB
MDRINEESNNFLAEKENLRVFIDAARKRKKTLDHVILSGSPGLGKTTLARIISEEMNARLYTTIAPNLSKRGDLAQILTVLKPGDILFIDEIHRLSTAIEEVLYSAMEDLCIDLILGEGLGAKSVRIPINQFTLIGATTRVGDMSAPLLDRFGIQLKLDFYDEAALQKIIQRSTKIYKMRISLEASGILAGRCRKTPRIANRLLKRIRDYAIAYNRINKELNRLEELDSQFIDEVLLKLEIDSLGLTRQDRQLLSAVIDKYNGGPVGLKVLAILLGEQERTIEDTVEPFLIRTGLLIRTPRGRVAGRLAYDHLGLNFPEQQQLLMDNLLKNQKKEQTKK